MSDTKEPLVRNTAAADYYEKEWKDEGSLGWLVREHASRTGLSIQETLSFFIWLERFAYNKSLREEQERQAELRPLLIKHLKQIDKESDEESSWRDT